MELKPEQLAARGASETLHPVYLIAGPETLRVLEAADAVRAQARAQGIGEREVFDADGRDFDWDRLEASFNAPSLFSARRVSGATLERVGDCQLLMRAWRLLRRGNGNGPGPVMARLGEPAGQIENGTEARVHVVLVRPSVER
jgi:hypothetical protein